MKIGFRFAAALLCTGVLALGPAQSAENKPDLLTPEERAWLAAHPRIVLGVGADWAPHVVKDANGQFSGFIFDHLELLNRKLGTNIRIEAGPWHEMVARAEAREIAGLTLTAPLDERRARFEFTNVFVSAYDFIYLRNADLLKRDAPRGLDGLRGQRVGYLKGTARVGSALARLESITAVAAPTYAELARMLLLGEIDAAVAAYALEFWRASNGVLGFTPVRAINDTEARLVMSVRKDWPELVGILNKGLAAIGKGEIDALHLRWFGAEYLARTAIFNVNLAPEERAWLAAHPVVRVAIDPNWAPVEFVDRKGAARGMSAAYLQRLEKILGVRFEFASVDSWSEAVTQLTERQLDLLPAMAATPERRKRAHFTEPYLTFPASIFSAADVAYVGGPDSLKGRTVAVVKDESVEAWLRGAWPEIKLMPFRDTAEALRAVARGEAYAFIGNLVTTSYRIGESGLTQIKVAGETTFEYRLSMGVRSDWPMLAAVLQKGIDAIPAHERDAIYRDWISIRYEQRVDYALLWYVAGGAGLLLLLVLVERAVAMKRANARLQHLARENSLVEERERRRLATELHDSPMQKLALAQIQFGAARREAGPGSAVPMATGLELMREAIDELRTLQFELSPPMLHQEGLAPALRWLASHASERSGVAFSFHGRAPTAALPQDLAIVLFQCARELVYNVAKHASAQTASIGLDAGDGGAELTVADDGKGMRAVDASRGQSVGGGFGLFSVRERLALFGGSLSVSSGTEGTRVIVRVPIRRRAGRDEATDAARLGEPRSGPSALAP